jgi:hypothetical protein
VAKDSHSGSLAPNLKLDDIKRPASRLALKKDIKKKRAARLDQKFEVWSRKKLNAAKGVAKQGGVPTRPGLVLSGKETKPSTIILPYLDDNVDDLEAGILTDHIAGTPAVVCRFAQAAVLSGQRAYVRYVIDQDTGRAEYAVGRITGKHKGREKGSLPNLLGEKRATDHAGHGTPEAGVDQPDLVNTLLNLVPQDGTANVSHKKTFENFVIKYAQENPSKVVHTIHERHYEKDSLRPKAETHYMVVDGKVVGAVTIGNP